MNHIYLGLTLSLICLFLLYYILPKSILVTVICVILAGLYFKDDFILFRYIAAHVASFYSWFCDLISGIQIMYHQSNNANFPIRKSVENNGTVPRKFERLHQGSSYNLSTSYVVDNHSINSSTPIWDSGSKFSSLANHYGRLSRTQSTSHEMSKLNINHLLRSENLGLTSDHHSKSYSSLSVSPLMVAYAGNTQSMEVSRSGSSPFPASLDHSSNLENKPPLNAKLYADVSSPGFCGRVADRLHEEVVTHQPKYDTVGAFPIVNLKSQSPKIKIKTPVRVRLAPPSNQLVPYNYGVSTTTRSPILGSDDSMKSVLQVLKEISRKRIHSHIDDDIEEGSKRLRVTDSDGLHHTSLLQQTIQGKRAREESSPNEDDKKRRKASLKNNEILSSLSSSISIRPPHLQTVKRKAQSIDDSSTSTPVLGKLLKVQREITPPASSSHIVAPDPVPPAPAPAKHIVVPAAAVKVLTAKTSPSPAILSPIAPPPTVAEPVPVKATVAIEEPKPKPEEDGAVSRLLGRMSDQTTRSPPIDIPVKRNVFMSTNDLSLSPPKENRLAAMIAVLGGPSDQFELENTQQEDQKQPDRLIRGKALFTSPETPALETPKQNKKVTFSDSLTRTKVFERDDPSNNSDGPPSTPLPLSSVAFGSSTNTTPTGPKPFALNFSSSPLPSNKEAEKTSKIVDLGMSIPKTTAAVGNSSTLTGIQTASISGPSFSVPVQVSNNSIVNTPSSGGFSFGSNSSLVNASKESSSDRNTDPPFVKSFSFGSDSKTSQPASLASGFPSMFSSATSKTESKTAADAMSSAEQNKPMFNMFANKDTPSFAIKKEVEGKPLVNGFAPTSSSSSPFALSQPVSQVNTSNPLPSFAANPNPTTTSQTAPSFNFGSATAFSTSSNASLTTQQSTLSTFKTTSQQAATPFQPNSFTSATASPSINIFSSSISSPVQSKSSPFGSCSQGTTTFGDSGFKPVPSSGQTSQTNSMFGSTPSQPSGFGSTPSQSQFSGFGSSPALQNGAVSSTSGTGQSNNLFGNISSNATNKPISFGSEPNVTTQPSTVFGFTGIPASTQAGSPFGSSTSNTPTMFGNSTTAQTASVFGRGTSITGSQSNSFPTPSTTAGQTSLFGGIANSDASKNIFTGAPNTKPTFGGLDTASSPAFGSQSNPAPTFGGQSTTASSNFGNQSAPAFTFGSQNTTTNQTPSGFGGAGTFGGSSSSSSLEVKPAAFGSSSPFMFGSSSTSKPTEAVKPLVTATPFAFGSSAQQSSVTPSVPSFGAPNPTFGAGISQPAAPSFQFGQTSSSPAPAFQLNAAPSTGGGGMFSIGSGGSSASRTKTTALRRSHKRT